MSAQYLPTYRFGKGLQDRVPEDFQAPDEFRVAQNVRFAGTAQRRAGRARVAAVASDQGAMDFDGVNDAVTVPLDTRVWTLGLRWSLRFLVSGDDTPAGDEYILGWAGAGNKPLTIKRDSSRKIVVDFWDSAGTQTTLTSTTATTNGTAYPCMVTRSTSTLTLWVANTAEVTSTSVSATLLGRTPTAALTFGAHNSANYFDGTIDHADLQAGVVLADNADGWLRLTDPRADAVVACYGMEKDSNNMVPDLSRYENTGLASGPTNTTAICVVTSPVLLMHPWLDATTGTKKVLVNAGGRVYAVPMA